MKTVRGQSAVEYMMTYGWGILVVLVAGVLLWQLGVFDPKPPPPDKRGFSQVVPLDWGLTATGDLNIIIQNNAGTIVELTDAFANMLANGKQPPECTDPAIPAAPDNQMRPGATMQLTFTGCPLESTKIGTYYKVNVTIGYTNQASTLTHKSNGVLWGPLG